MLDFLPEFVLCCSFALVGRAHSQILALKSHSPYRQQRPSLSPSFVASLLDSPVLLRFVRVLSLKLPTSRPLSHQDLWALVELFPFITSLEISGEVNFAPDLDEIGGDFLAFDHLTSFCLITADTKVFPSFNVCVEALIASRALTEFTMDTTDYGLNLTGPLSQTSSAL